MLDWNTGLGWNTYTELLAEGVEEKFKGALEKSEKVLEKSEKVEESVKKSKSWTIRRISRRVHRKVWNAIDKYVEARVLKYIVLNN